MALRSRMIALAFCAGLGGSAHAASYLEAFEAPFPAWETGWLGAHSDLANYYGDGMGRGNNPDGLWIGKADIRFDSVFAATITSFSLDVAAWGDGVVHFYDKTEMLIDTLSYRATFGALTDPGSYFHLSIAATNGLSHFTFVGDSYGVLGNTSIDNLAVTAVPEPGSYALLLAGLGVIGSVVRRRGR